MIPRRGFLAGTLAFAAVPELARAQVQRIRLPAGMEQGRLVIGHSEEQARLSLDGTPLSLSPRGAFAFGIAYDRTRPLRLEAEFADGGREAHTIAPIARIYQTQSITGLPQNEVTPPPDILARIRRESETIAEARQRDGDGLGFSTVFQWPVHGILSGVYGSRRILNGIPMAPHLGVDIAAPEGTPIRAPADGLVTVSAAQYLNGNLTLLDHGHGVTTCYLHQRRLLTRLGDQVAQGQIIGHVGQTGRATGPNLHWGLNWFQVKLDPSLSTAEPEPPKA